MTIILIIICIWGASALLRAAKTKKQQRELERIRAEQLRQRAERQEQIRQHNEEVRQRIEQQRELMRLAKAEREQAEWNRKQEEINRRQAEHNRKTDERLLKIEQKLELAQRDEAHYADEVTAITIDMAGVKAYVDYMRGKGLPCKSKETELEKLGKKLYTAETKLIKARQQREFCEKQMEVA